MGARSHARSMRREIEITTKSTPDCATAVKSVTPPPLFSLLIPHCNRSASLAAAGMVAQGWNVSLVCQRARAGSWTVSCLALLSLPGGITTSATALWYCRNAMEAAVLCTRWAAITRPMGPTSVKFFSFPSVEVPRVCARRVFAVVTSDRYQILRWSRDCSQDVRFCEPVSLLSYCTVHGNRFSSRDLLLNWVKRFLH